MVVAMVEKRTARGGDDGGSGGDSDGGSSADIELQADYHRARINALPRGNETLGGPLLRDGFREDLRS
ncbi:hypothetical protein HZH68_004792 [Vespula germanica]|uniref:Uncharacterized protein n=1 Tax=Vespula germanica TaxID=30212 RepID=A0A834KR83_VESGE|nr:hypothetical protein HZH68_004792 [Vespula germanica]